MSSLTEYSHRKLVTALSYHIVYGEWASTALWGGLLLAPSLCLPDITSSASLMPTAMVAFLLLNRHRKVLCLSVMSLLLTISFLPLFDVSSSLPGCEGG